MEGDVTNEEAVQTLRPGAGDTTPRNGATPRVRKRAKSKRSRQRRVPTAQSTREMNVSQVLPYMTAPGNVPRILEKIKEGRTPERFTQDHLSDVFGFSGGSAMQFIPLAKRIGFLAPDGTPTETYRSFRNAEESGDAMLRALRTGYASLYERNENVHRLDRTKLEGLVMQVTGLAKGSATVRAILGTFEALRRYASEDLSLPTPREDKDTDPGEEPPRTPTGLRLGYTINLNLPNTADIAVFNAVFKSLRDNLLS